MLAAPLSLSCIPRGNKWANTFTNLGRETRAKRDLKRGVGYLFYRFAFALTDGVSIFDKVKEFWHEHLLPLAFDFADDGTVLNRDPKTLLIGPWG